VGGGALKAGENTRDEKWTKSIAVGSKSFVDDVKTKLGILAKGRKSRQAEEGYQLRETVATYKAHFGVKNTDIGFDNAYLWNINRE
jgi:putative transposase